jgi:peptide/nickel transport system substrate-binding protein
MNTQKEPFGNPKVRQAINMALEMPKIVNFALGDTAQVATTYQPPTVPYFNESIQRYPYDPDKARQMLSEAGAENLQTNLWYMPIPRPYMPDAKSIAQAMQQDLKKVGVDAKLVTYDWPVYLTKTGSGEHDMCLLGWTADNGDPDNFLGQLLSSKTATPQNALNVAYYKNPEVDKLIEQGRTTSDDNERRNIYMRLQEIIAGDAPWAPIAYVKPPVGLQKEVQGYEPNPTGGEPFNTITLGGGGA